MFNTYNDITRTNEVSTCKRIDVIESCVTQVGVGNIVVYPLEICLPSYVFSMDDEDWDI